MQIAILGRQPKLSLAELESLYGPNKISVIGTYAAIVDTDQPLPNANLGGAIKSAKLLTRLQNTDVQQAFDYLQSAMPDHLSYLPAGKLQLGISLYGYRAPRKWLLQQTLTLKKVIKNHGRSVRIIENKSEALESAQVLYNKLTGPLGWELLMIKDGSDCVIAQTTGVQNIDNYSKRDFDRPMRDAYVGMLPPKLAQIMINLAIDGKKALDPQTRTYVLDPFCGTGVVLQEALLMGYTVIGSDLSQKMVDYSTKNIDWLAQNYPHLAQKDDLPAWHIMQADATSHTWDLSQIQDPSVNLHIVCETYLGTPLSSLPPRDSLDTIVREANTVAEGFLTNIAKQIKSGTRLTVALPAWHLGSGQFYHLPVLDQISNLGYNRLDLKHATTSDLIYHRDDQVVARELTLLVRS